ncbi:hypothetical protein XF36_05915 [Pseudonocardia sp. HH130629-09]|nr:hypothetical protein XF36_05915 [Pseudonocardia sp. HH130629-09]
MAPRNVTRGAVRRAAGTATGGTRCGDTPGGRARRHAADDPATSRRPPPDVRVPAQRTPSPDATPARRRIAPHRHRTATAVTTVAAPAPHHGTPDRLRPGSPTRRHRTPAHPGPGTPAPLRATGLAHRDRTATRPASAHGTDRRNGGRGGVPARRRVAQQPERHHRGRGAQQHRDPGQEPLQAPADPAAGRAGAGRDQATPVQRTDRARRRHGHRPRTGRRRDPGGPHQGRRGAWRRGGTAGRPDRDVRTTGDATRDRRIGRCRGPGRTPGNCRTGRRRTGRRNTGRRGAPGTGSGVPCNRLGQCALPCTVGGPPVRGARDGRRAGTGRTGHTLRGPHPLPGGAPGARGGSAGRGGTGQAADRAVVADPLVELSHGSSCRRTTRPPGGLVSPAPDRPFPEPGRTGVRAV